jgi:hypothetical protein
VHAFACSQGRGVLPTMLPIPHSCINTMWSVSFFRGQLVDPPTRIIWLSTTCHGSLACVWAGISWTRSIPPEPPSARSLHRHGPTTFPRTLSISCKLNYLSVHSVLDPSGDASLVCVAHKQSAQSLLVISPVPYGPTTPAMV